ncbi:MAG: hypothetical protein R3B82_11365, partial [Sandaracinaceae bacterium]
GLIAGGASVAAGVGLLAYPYERRRLHDARQRWRAREAARQAKHPTPLSQVTSGRVAIEGRVQILEGVAGPDADEPLAAWVERAWIRRSCACTPRCPATFWSLRTRWRTGRFAIVDDSGVAVVDGAALDLFITEQPLGEGRFVGLRHGDRVRAIGHADAIEAPDVANPAQGTYRHRGRPVGLFGTDEAPILILGA